MNHLSSSFDTVGEFQQGDIVTFEARVGKYIKGYFGERIEDCLNHLAKEDYWLKYPHNVKLIGTWDVNNPTDLLIQFDVFYRSRREAAECPTMSDVKNAR